MLLTAGSGRGMKGVAGIKGSVPGSGRGRGRGQKSSTGSKSSSQDESKPGADDSRKVSFTS